MHRGRPFPVPGSGAKAASQSLLGSLPRPTPDIPPLGLTPYCRYPGARRQWRGAGVWLVGLAIAMGRKPGIGALLLLAHGAWLLIQGCAGSSDNGDGESLAGESVRARVVR